MALGAPMAISGPPSTMKSPMPATAVPVRELTWAILVNVKTLMSLIVLIESRSTSFVERVPSDAEP